MFIHSVRSFTLNSTLFSPRPHPCETVLLLWPNENVLFLFERDVAKIGSIFQNTKPMRSKFMNLEQKARKHQFSWGFWAALPLPVLYFDSCNNSISLLFSGLNAPRLSLLACLPSFCLFFLPALQVPSACSLLSAPASPFSSVAKEGRSREGV